MRSEIKPVSTLALTMHSIRVLNEDVKVALVRSATDILNSCDFTQDSSATAECSYILAASCTDANEGWDSTSGGNYEYLSFDLTITLSNLTQDSMDKAQNALLLIKDYVEMTDRLVNALNALMRNMPITAKHWPLCSLRVDEE